MPEFIHVDLDSIDWQEVRKTQVKGPVPESVKTLEDIATYFRIAQYIAYMRAHKGPKRKRREKTRRRKLVRAWLMIQDVDKVSIEDYVNYTAHTHLRNFERWIEQYRRGELD